MEAKRGCKIRKRGCSSSSSSSLARKKNRFKRAILGSKRTAGGSGWSGTPVKPTPVGKSPGFNMVSPERHQMDHQFQSSSVSARKLAAMVWEIGNGIRSPGNSNGDYLGIKQRPRNREKAVLSPSQNFPPNLSDLISGFNSERKGRSTDDLIQRTSKVSQKSQVNAYNITGRTDSMESRRRGKCCVRLKEFSDSLTTSKEIVKALTTRVGVVYDHHDRETPSSSKMLISALRCELDRSRSILNRLMKEHRKTSKKEIIMQCLTEEKSEFMKRREREREKERMKRAAISREIGVERKLRKQTERVNKKLGRELANAKIMLSKAKEELESERRAKEILEEVCEELVRGVGEDKAEIEKIRREAEKVKEEVEKEREMMQIANSLREERVQMKLSEARYEFEEKNAEVEKMKSELEDYLIKKDCESDDLESIELNMDSVDKVYKWSYEESGKFSGKNCRKVYQKGSNDDSTLMIDFQTANPKSGFIQEHIEGGSVGDRGDGPEDEIDREKCIKNLRDFIISNMST